MKIEGGDPFTLVTLAQGKEDGVPAEISQNRAATIAHTTQVLQVAPPLLVSGKKEENPWFNKPVSSKRFSCRSISRPVRMRPFESPARWRVYVEPS
ncbi:protein of unknown function [Candidatus Nitrospira inopinata]|uniref:Uncharacterized protein n=1 Tax=Candidatus Nitrospira inopinata TaxID=1715989 RepID=A0A0S4KQF1_9BACT|nr:protein of unknown function [Candidatus Nitrospira inopinata]